jgi:hypothetical protein
MKGNHVPKTHRVTMDAYEHTAGTGAAYPQATAQGQGQGQAQGQAHLYPSPSTPAVVRHEEKSENEDEPDPEVTPLNITALNITSHSNT